MDELEKKVSEIQETNKKLISDIQLENERRLKGYMTDAAFAEYKAAFEKRFGEVNDELAKLKVHPITDTGADKDRPEHKAFEKYLRNGVESLDVEERKALCVPTRDGMGRKALTLADATHAGVLAPAEYVNQIYHYAAVMHPIRTVATVRQTNAYEIQVPVNDAGCVATWVAEGGTKTETTAPTYALTTIIPQKMQILLKATTEWLADQAFNAEEELALQAGRALGALESTAFYSGNGTTTGPEGMVANATVVADARDVATDNTIVFDDFIKTQYALLDPYVANASWLMNRATMGMCVTLKNATTANYLLQPTLQQGQPANILGSPVYTWSDVTAQADATPGDAEIILLYGDFRQGYMVVDRLGMTIQRLNELYAATGYVGFLITARVGGGVIIPPAIQILKNITT
jgi:HK97 family phage major capsid protein